MHQETGDNVAIKFIHAGGNPDAVSAKKEKAKKVAFTEEVVYSQLVRVKGVPKILWKGSSTMGAKPVYFLFLAGHASA